MTASVTTPPTRPTPRRSPRLRLRRLDLAAVAAGDAGSPARVRGARPARRRRPTPRSAKRPARPSPTSVRAATTAVRDANAARRRRPPGRPPRPRAARAARRPRRASTRPSAAPSTRRSTTSAASPRPSGRPRPGPTIAPGIEIERRWTPLGRVGAYVPGGSAPYPSSLVMTVVPARVAGVGQVVVASPGRPRRPRRTRSCSARRACSRSMPSSSPAAPRRSARSRSGCPTRASSRSTGSSGRATPGSPRPRSRSCGEVGIDLPAGPSEGMVLAAPPADPRPRRRRPHHPGRARPRLAGDPRHDRRGLRRRGRGRGRGASSTGRTRRDILAARAPRPRPDRPRADARRRHRRSSTPTRPSTSRSTSSRSSRPSTRLRNAGSLFVGPWAPESAGDYATGANHVLPTGGLARASGGLSVEAYGKFVQVQRIDRDGLASIRDTIATLAEAEGLLAHRDAVEIRFEDRAAMSPTPVTFNLADRAVVVQLGGDRRGGRGPLRRRPGDASSGSTSTPPRPRRRSSPRLLAAGRFEAPLSEYPPTDYRRLVEAAAARYGVDADGDPRRRRRRRDPRHRRQGVPAGRRAGGRPDRRPMRCTASSPSSAAPRSSRSRASGADGRLGARPGRRPRGRRRATPRSSGCAARTTRPRWPSRTARSRRSSPGSPRTPPRPAAPAPIVVLDEAYAEFVGTLARRPARRLPEPHRRPHREQGLRPGRAAGRLRHRPARGHRPAQPVPAAGLGVDGVGHAS